MKTLSIIVVLLATLASATATDDIILRNDVAEVVDGWSVTWTSENFAVFLYDVDHDLGRVSLQLNVTGQSVEVGDAIYTSSAQERPFEHDDWGSYRVLNFLGESYLAGYGDDCQIASAWSSLEEDQLLGKVLIDTDEKTTVGSNEDLLLEDGYRVRFGDAKAGIRVSLYKGKNLVDTATIAPPDTYVYTTQMNDRNVTLMAVHVAGSVRLDPTSYYTTRGLFQISENPIEIELEARDGLMEVTALDDGELVMTNFQRLNLTPNNDFGLMGDLRIKTANQSKIAPGDPLRFYVYKELTEPGTYEIRGMIANIIDGASYTWGPQDFVGFYYDIDNDLGTEVITMTITGGGTLAEPCGVIYRTTAQWDNFDFDEWGHYYTIGFLGEKYFAGYVVDWKDPKDNARLWYESTDENLMADEQLTKVLVNSNELQTIRSGEILILDEDFEAKISVDNTCEKVFLELYRNDDLVDVDYFTAPGTYTYCTDLGETEDIVILALHIAGIDCTTSDRTCTVDGIWQISDMPIDIEEDTEYDKMTIQAINSDEDYMFIEMDNEDNRITLDKNMDVQLMGKIWIKVADQDEISAGDPLRFYIYEEATIE